MNCSSIFLARKSRFPSMIQKFTRVVSLDAKTGDSRLFVEYARRLVGGIGHLVWVTTLLAPPLLYLAVGYYYEARAIDSTSSYIARSISHAMEVGDLKTLAGRLPPFANDAHRLADRSSAYSVLDRNERVVLKSGGPVPSPAFTQTTRIVVSGATVGSLVVEASLRPYLLFAGAMFLLSIIAAAAALVAVRIIPLNILSQAFGVLEGQNCKLRQGEEKLRAQNHHLEMAVGNISQGLCLYDADERIIMANGLYATLYGLQPEQVKPGLLLRDVMDSRIAAGASEFSSSDDYFAERTIRLNGAPRVGVTKRIVKLPNGRIIAVRRRAMPRGGWVCTHEDVTEQHKYERNLAYQANHDALTGLPNRTRLVEAIAQALETKQPSSHLAVYLLDLDNFKSVNDTLGHPVGDMLLQAIAGRLKGVIVEPNIVARMGGDEFAIVQIGVIDPREISILANRVIAAIGDVYEIDGHQISISASVGIAISPRDGDTSEQLIRCADLALYHAKEKERGDFSIFEPWQDELVRTRTALKNDLHNAMKSGQLELHYQPIIEFQTSVNCGVEALIRWNHPTRGLISPAEFIPLAEDSGFIVPLGAWILRQACMEVASWPRKLCCAVNLSPVQFKRRGLVETVLVALSASGLPADRLVLEITESVFLGDTQEVIETLTRLREIGVVIALDDFGTGYSSLSYLRNLPINVVKIDRSFVKDVGRDATALSVIRAVVNLSRNLGLTTVAEGVETREQYDLLRAEGMDKAQGFFISKPRSAEDVRAYLFPDEGRKSCVA